MSYYIRFATKVVELPNKKFLVLTRGGCNNDDSGRDRNEFEFQVMTKGEFWDLVDTIKYLGVSQYACIGSGRKLKSSMEFAKYLANCGHRAMPFDRYLERNYMYVKVTERVSNEVIEFNGSTWYRYRTNVIDDYAEMLKFFEETENSFNKNCCVRSYTRKVVL